MMTYIMLSLLIAAAAAGSNVHRRLRGNARALSTADDCTGPFSSDCEGRIVWLTENYLTSSSSQRYLAGGVDGSRCSAQHFLSTVENFCPPVTECKGPFPDEFATCEGRIVWLTENYLTAESSHTYLANGVDGSRCSAQRYLSTVESFCPPVDPGTPNTPGDSTTTTTTAPTSTTITAAITTPSGMAPPTCGNPDSTSVTVASQNLFWWNLFNRRGGANFFNVFKAHGPFDILLLQECDNVHHIVTGLGLDGCFAADQGAHAVSIAWNNVRFERIGSGARNVGVDRPEQFFGSRGVVWARLRERASGSVFFVVSHHGPLPVNSGGTGGGASVAANIKAVIAEHAGAEDTVVLGGDFNADVSTATVQGLEGAFDRVISDWVDHMFVSAKGGHVVDSSVIRDTGSDHRGLKLRFQMTP